MFLKIVKVSFWTVTVTDVPAASSHKQFQPPTVVLTSDSDTNTEEEENSES
jgi:hypothetical protein